LEAADGAEKLAIRGIEDIHVIATCDVDAVCGRVDEEVVPAAGVGELPVVQNFVGALGASGGRDEGAKESGHEESGSELEGEFCAHGKTFHTGRNGILISERIVACAD
jgi:hypothetical protein